MNCYIFDNHHGLVFNPDSIRILREQHRIIGCLTGNLPEYPRQNNELGLPLELSCEECCLLSDQKILSLYKIILPIDDCELDLEFEKQKITNGHERINEILINRQSILQKKSSFNENTNDNDSFILSLLETNNAWQNCSKSLDDDEKDILLRTIKQCLKQFTLDFMFIKLSLESKRTNLQLYLIHSQELLKKILQ